MADGSPDEKRERKVLARGQSRLIICALIAAAKSPVQDFLDGLDLDVTAKFFALFQLMADQGKISNDRKFHREVHLVKCHVGGKITEFPVGEFKVHAGPGYRIMACLDGREWVLTHGFQKGGKVSIEGDKAGRIFCEDRAIRLAKGATKG